MGQRQSHSEINVATNQGIPGATRSWKRLRTPLGGWSVSHQRHLATDNRFGNNQLRRLD